MKSRTVLVKAIASGVAVANIYYAQPVLVEIAHTFGVGPKDVGLVAVAIQVGYALGILFFVPFGDIAERRTLCVGLAAVSVIAMTVCALAPSLLVLGIAGCIAGVTSITAQILIPFAADLATPEKRGRVIAQVQTGVIMGIIFARVAGGFIGGNFGWRTVFWFGAAASAFATIAMWRALPRHQGHNRLTYPQLLASLAPLLREHRGLRVSCALGFCAFATFSAFWTTVPFHLASMGLGPAFVGSLGLTAMIGAFVAVNVGTFADKYGSVATGAFALVMLGIAWTIYWSGANVAWFFVVRDRVCDRHAVKSDLESVAHFRARRFGSESTQHDVHVRDVFRWCGRVVRGCRCVAVVELDGRLCDGLCVHRVRGAGAGTLCRYPRRGPQPPKGTFARGRFVSTRFSRMGSGRTMIGFMNVSFKEACN